MRVKNKRTRRRGLQLNVSMSRKVNIGNYESADVFISVSGLTSESTQADIDALIDKQGALAFRSIAARIKEKVIEFNEKEWQGVKEAEQASPPPLIPVFGGRK